MIPSSCSTTSTLFPKSRNRFSVPINRSVSTGCNPMLGSSKTYSTPASPAPICVASRIRCISPPDSVPLSRFNARYPSPTCSRNANRFTISFSKSTTYPR